MKRIYFLLLSMLLVSGMFAEAVPGFEPQKGQVQVSAEIMQLVQAVNADSIMSYIQALQDFETRYYLAENRLEIATWLRDQFIRFGVTDTEFQIFEHPIAGTQYNVIATLPGQESEDEYIYIGAHYDSILWHEDQSMVFAPGADDDASGCAAILEIARIMMLTGFQPRCNIRFVTFAMEEPGKIGALYCSSKLRESGTRLRVYINLDMVAYIDDTYDDWRIRLHPYTGSEQQHQFAWQQAALYSELNPMEGAQDTVLGDSHYFWWNGFPTIYLQEPILNPHMHTVEDTIDKLNPQFCAQMVKAIMASLAGYSLMPAMPREMRVLDGGSGHELVVEWASPIDASITQHKICYTNADGSIHGEEITTGTSHTISGLVQEEEYTVKLYSMGADGKHSFWVQDSGIPRVIPLKPLNLCETPIRDAILISWDANTEADLAGYILYKSNSASHPGTPVTSLPISATNYTDTEVNSQERFYHYTLQAIDHDGNASEFSDGVSSRPITFDRGILIVDETKHNDVEGTYFIPNDLVDAFYESLLAGFTVDQFDCEEHDELLRLADIGVYSSILWHGNDVMETDYIARVKPAIEGYLAAGGKILFSVMGIDRCVGQDDFAAQCLGIQQAQTPSLGRFRYANSVYDGMIDMQVDSQTNSYIYNDHLNRITALYPTDSAQILYVADSDYEDDDRYGVLNGLPVGLRNFYEEGEAITLSIPLYYIYQNQAQNFVHHVFRYLFMESSANEDENQSPSVRLAIGTNHPNPFSQSTSFAISVKDEFEPISVGVYNLRGQKVRTLVKNSIPRNITELSWDGKDEKGVRLASGIYLLRLTQGTRSVGRKVLLLH